MIHIAWSTSGLWVRIPAGSRRLSEERALLVGNLVLFSSWQLSAAKGASKRDPKCEDRRRNFLGNTESGQCVDVSFVYLFYFMYLLFLFSDMDMSLVLVLLHFVTTGPEVATGTGGANAATESDTSSNYFLKISELE